MARGLQSTPVPRYSPVVWRPAILQHASLALRAAAWPTSFCASVRNRLPTPRSQRQLVRPHQRAGHHHVFGSMVLPPDLPRVSLRTIRVQPWYEYPDRQAVAWASASHTIRRMLPSRSSSHGRMTGISRLAPPCEIISVCTDTVPCASTVHRSRHSVAEASRLGDPVRIDLDVLVMAAAQAAVTRITERPVWILQTRPNDPWPMQCPIRSVSERPVSQFIIPINNSDSPHWNSRCRTWMSRAPRVRPRDRRRP